MLVRMDSCLLCSAGPVRRAEPSAQYCLLLATIWYAECGLYGRKRSKRRASITRPGVKRFTESTAASRLPLRTPALRYRQASGTCLVRTIVRRSSPTILQERYAESPRQNRSPTRMRLPNPQKKRLCHAAMAKGGWGIRTSGDPNRQGFDLFFATTASSRTTYPASGSQGSFGPIR